MKNVLTARMTNTRAMTLPVTIFFVVDAVGIAVRPNTKAQLPAETHGGIARSISSAKEKHQTARTPGGSTAAPC
jgi:hypothetical protein